MNGHPLQTVQELDPELFARVNESREFTFRDGALPASVKYLIAAALDAAHGAAGGVASLAGQAVEHGATREQVMEALRVAAYISGVGSVYTASFGLKDAFTQS